MDRYLKATTKDNVVEEVSGGKGKKQTSKVWEHFQRIKDKQIAVCLHCKKTYKMSGNTTNLMFHLKRCYPQFESMPKPSSPTSLDKFVELENTYERNSAKQKKIDKAVMLMIAKDLQPFSVVNDSGFRSLVKELDAKYKIPSKNYFRNVVLLEHYELLKCQIMTTLDSVESISITTDCWTSKAVECYLTVTCHFVDANFILKSAVLSTRKLLDVTNHTANNISDTLRAIFEEWNISDKIVNITTDNDSTMIKACENLKIKNLPCVSHTINLLAQDVLKFSSFKELLSKCKRIVTFFKSSTNANEKFKIAQNVTKPYSLIQEVTTRWNSALFMIQRILLTNESIYSVLLNTPKAPQPFSADEIGVLEDLAEMLSPLHEATLQMSATNTVTSSLILPTICELQNKFTMLNLKTQEVKDAFLYMMEQFKVRFLPYEKRTLPRLATFIDPRFKRDGFLSTFNADQAAIALENEVCSVLSKISKEHPTPPVEPPSTKKMKYSFLQNKSDVKIRSSRVDAILLLRQYNESQNLSEDKEPLPYWKMQNEGMAALQKLAKRYLSVQASSCESERTFSKAGEILSDRRSCLKPKIVDKLLFINKNHNM